MLAKLHPDTCRNLLNLTKCELDGFDFGLRIRMPRLSEVLILQARNCVEIHNLNLQRNWGGKPLAVNAEQKYVHIFENKGRYEMWNYRSFAVKAEGKCGGKPSHIFGNDCRVLAEKPIFRSLAVKIEWKCRRETADLWKSRQRWNAEAELHIFGSRGRTSAESVTLFLCQSRQSGSADAELNIFGSQGRTKVRTWNFRSLAVKTERKRNFRSLAVKAERKCGSGISDL